MSHRPTDRQTDTQPKQSERPTDKKTDWLKDTQTSKKTVGQDTQTCQWGVYSMNLTDQVQGPY